MTSDAELDRLEDEWDAAKGARIDREAEITRAYHDAGPDEDDVQTMDSAWRAEMDPLKEAEEDALDAYKTALRTRVGD
jgi:hypothetical protein